MKITEVSIHWDRLAEFMELPENCIVAGINDVPGQRSSTIRIVSHGDIPVAFNAEKLQDIGHAFRHPDMFQDELNKGAVRGSDY